MYSFATVEEADAYFANRFQNAEWSDCDTDRKQRALYEASSRIDQLRFSGYRTSESQNLSFPRCGETEIPEPIKFATCELAYFLIDDGSVEEELRGINRTSGGMYSARSSRNTGFVQEHVANGVPSFTAWVYLRPYLADPHSIQLSRG